MFPDLNCYQYLRVVILFRRIDLTSRVAFVNSV